MGLFSKTADERAAAKALFDLRHAVGQVGGMLVRKDPLRFTAQGQMDVPVRGAKITIDRGEAAKRLTLTRAALIGPFALLAKKDATKLFITIEGTDGSAMLREVPARKEGEARRLAVLVHAQWAAQE